MGGVKGDQEDEAMGGNKPNDRSALLFIYPVQFLYHHSRHAPTYQHALTIKRNTAVTTAFLDAKCVIPSVANPAGPAETTPAPKDPYRVVSNARPAP